MTLLTDKEYAEVKVKVKQIEEFIRTNILPYIDQCYEIPFGTRKERSGKSRLNLYVYSSPQMITGYSGHLYISFQEDYKPSEIGGGVSIYDSCTYGGNFGYELISSWPMVKSKLIDLTTKKQREMSERKAVLDSFKI
jgi:hypothetical protein